MVDLQIILYWSGLHKLGVFFVNTFHFRKSCHPFCLKLWFPSTTIYIKTQYYHYRGSDLDGLQAQNYKVRTMLWVLTLRARFSKGIFIKTCTEFKCSKYYNLAGYWTLHSSCLIIRMRVFEQRWTSYQFQPMNFGQLTNHGPTVPSLSSVVFLRLIIDNMNSDH